MSKKLRVGHIITRMDWGGPPDILRIIFDLYDKEKFDMKLIMGDSKNLSAETGRFLKHCKGNIVSIPSLRRNINPIKDLKAFFDIYRTLKREKFDIVHTHTAKAGAIGRAAAKLAGVKYTVHTLHGHNFYGYFGPVGSMLMRFYEFVMSKMTDKIMALTKLEKKDLVDCGICEEGKIIVINSGVELDKFRIDDIDTDTVRRELSIGSKDRVVGIISRLESVKGVQYFVQAAREVLEERSDVKFLIVGEGSLRKQLEEECKEYGIEKKVIFTGWKEKISEVLSILDMIVLPSLNEAVGRVLIEAGAAGVPAIAANVGGVPEVVIDSVTGILVSPESSDEFARAIEFLLDNNEERLDMSEKVRGWIDEKFSAEKMVKEIMGIYTSSLK